MADPKWLWADPIVLNFIRVPAFEEVNACQWSEPRLLTNEMRVWFGPGYNFNPF